MRQVRLTIKEQFIADEFWNILRDTDIEFMFERVLDNYYLRVEFNDLNSLKNKIKYSMSEFKYSLTDVFETALITTLTNLGK